MFAAGKNFVLKCTPLKFHPYRVDISFVGGKNDDVLRLVERLDYLSSVFGISQTSQLAGCEKYPDAVLGKEIINLPGVCVIFALTA